MRASDLAELRRFAGAGTIGFIVDATILSALTAGLGANPYYARAVSFPVAVTVTWWWNRRYTFTDRSIQRKTSEYSRYFAVQVIGAFVNIAVYGLLLETNSVLREYPVLPLAVGAGAALILNFLLSKQFVFN